MEAELKIAGLDEVIQRAVEQSLEKAVDKVLKKVLDEFKAEMVSAKKDELLKKPVWTKEEIMLYTGMSRSWVESLHRKYKDFPKKKNQNDYGKAVWERDEMLKFFARHPEIPTTAKKDLKDKK